MKNPLDINIDALSQNPGRLRKIIDHFSSHPIVTKILDDEKAEVVRVRLELGEKMKALITKKDAEREVIAAKHEKALRELKKLEPGYEAAAARWRDARDELFLFNGYAKGEIDRARAEIEQSPAPLIDETLEKLHSLLQEQHDTPIDMAQVGSRWNENFTQKVAVWRTNVASKNARQRAILDALLTVTSMKAEHDHTDLPSRLKAVIENLPPIKSVEEEIEVDPGTFDGMFTQSPGSNSDE